MKDYYKILGVKKDASEEEIRKQWVEWMRKLHPDQHTEREAEDQRIREVNEAYEVLKHSSTRMEYDLKWAYGQKKRKSNPLRWSGPMVMIAVILVMVAVYVKKPKGTLQSALMVPTQRTESRSQNSESRGPKAERSNLTNEINQINQIDQINQTDQRNQKEQKPVARSQLSAFSDRRLAERSQKAEFRSQNVESRTQKAEGSNLSNEINQINQTAQRNEKDLRAELPQAPKMIMVSASEGDDVIQTAQSTPEPVAPSLHPPVSVSPRPPAPPSTMSLIATEEEVKQFFSHYVERYNQKDLEGFFSLFSMKATQSRQNKFEDIRKVYADFFNQSQTVRYHLYDTRTEIYQNALEMRARYELVQTLKEGGEKVWRGTIKWILVKENGALKILSLEYQPQKSL